MDGMDGMDGMGGFLCSLYLDKAARKLKFLFITYRQHGSPKNLIS